MLNGKLARSILSEYGINWAINRGLYSCRIKLISAVKGSERLFEKKTGYPSRLDIFEINTEDIRDFLQGLPQEKKSELRETADNACEGRLCGFNSVALDYGSPVNWQMDPLTGNECSTKEKWYDIPDFNEKRGDIKVIWEASRFAHFVTFARAYLLTGDKKYYRVFSGQLEDWIEKNPYSYGANFKCGQECALRMVNGLLAYTVFRNEGLAKDRDKRNMEVLVSRCYRKILGNFFYAFKCIKNNHTISELMGMIAGAWCCREEERLSRAYQTMDKVIDEQFTGDGGYRQFSFNYERLALQDLEAVLSMKTGYTLNDRSKAKILAAANLMYQCQDETGDMPNYGSNDGALVFPVTSCGYRDFRPVINTVHALLEGTRRYESGNHDEELLWFGGQKGYPAEKGDRTGSSFWDAGLYTFRSPGSWAMIVLNNYKSRPAHMDQMHFDLWVDGVNVLCDCGTYSYASDEGRMLVNNSAHNTVVCRAPQMNAYGAFMVYGWTRRGRTEYGKGYFSGEMISKNGYMHRRSVEATDSGYRITDDVSAGGAYQILFHTPCDVAEKDGVFELKSDGTALCRIKSTARGEQTKAVRSLYYLKKEKITCIRLMADRNTVVTDIEIMRQKKEIQ